MTRIIAVANQKGGVGKTTTCVNLSAALALARRRVLLVDLDAQGNATTGFGVDKNAPHPNISSLLLQESTIDASIQTARGIDLIAANRDLTAVKVQLMECSRREFRLRDPLRLVTDRYDYILIDCPPSLDMLTVNALVAAQGVLIPMQCEYYALEGLTDLLETITTIQRTVNPPLHIEGLLRTMYDGRSRLTREVSEELRQHFGAQLYRTVVPRNVTLAEAPSHGEPAVSYAQRSRGALAYLALAGEMLRRHDEPTVDSEA